jgi:hypothetical protein
MRSDLDKIERGRHKSYEEHHIAEAYRDKAARLGEKATGERPDVIYRRVKKFEAEERKFQKLLDEADLADKIEKKNPALLGKYYLNRDRSWPTQQLTRIRQRLNAERELYKASGGIATENITFKPGDRVQTTHGAGTLASISKKTVRVKLDPMENGRERWIYANSRGESLLSVDDIKGKL